MTHQNTIILYNTIDFLPRQVELLRKNVGGEIAVIDNSNDFSIAAQVRKFCTNNDVYYLKTAVNEADFSRSHSYACDIAVRMSDGFDSIFILDHDIVPYKPIDIKPYYDYLLCGNPQLRRGARTIIDVEPITYKYYWPGLLFVNLYQLQGTKVEFQPVIAGYGDGQVFLDTGGSLYKIIMGNQSRCLDFTERHEEDYAIFNESWLHFIKGSNWMKEDDEKHRERLERIFKVLEEKINV